VHLSRLKLADVCLDTWPFNGGATTSDALWSGVPVVTLTGMAFASRMSGSLLRAVGLPDLVCDTLACYERVALELARDCTALGRARSRLDEVRAGGGPFDTVKLTGEIETAYRIMCERQRSGAGPATFHVAASPHTGARAHRDLSPSMMGGDAA
jgi:predicted O-linked N-acetylglucosamine transferase (SPINDLY family)